MHENFCYRQSKGRGGKTTTAVNLAYVLATSCRLRVLVVDADGQANATQILLPPGEYAGLGALLRGLSICYDELVEQTDVPGLDVLPASADLWALDLEADKGALVHGLPRVLDDLLYNQNREDLWEGNKKGLPELLELDWSHTRPAQLFRLTREELRLGREQDWGVLFWRLFTGAKALGERLTGSDMVNAFYLGDDHAAELVGRGPVGKSLRYLLRQCELAGVEDEGDDPDPDGVIDVQTLLDYWDMAGRLGWDLRNERVRFPRNLLAAHDEAAAQAALLEERGLAGRFRIRRMVLRKYTFKAGGLLIRPARSQKELTEEGNTLHHCVSTYGKRHANGETAIFFIRQKDSPKRSYYTLELDEKELKVRQNRGLRNCPRTPEVQAFEELWLRWVRAGAPRDAGGKPVISGGKEATVA